MTLALLRVLILPFFVGAGLTRLMGLAPRSDPWSWPVWSWTLGSLATALVMLPWLWLAPPLDTPWMPELGLLLIGGAVWWRARDVPIAAPTPAPSAATWERLLFGGVVIFLLILGFQRLMDGDLWPIYEDDEAHVWALKAKILFHAGGFTDELQAVLENPDYLYHRDYPLLNPLLQIWTFAHFGEVTHVVNRVPIQLFALGLVPVLASALRRVVRPAAAAILLLAVMTCAETVRQGRTAHADMGVALGLVIAFDAWTRWRATGAIAWWRLFAIGAALALFTKGEGMVYALGVVIAFVVARLSNGPLRPGAAVLPRRALLLLVLPIALVALTWTLNWTFGFTNDIGATDLRDEPFLTLLRMQAQERLPLISTWLWDHQLWVRHWGGHLPVAFLLLFLFLARRLRRDPLFIPALAILAIWAGYILIFVGTPHDVDWHLTAAAPRITWQLVPATALWIAAAAGQCLPGFGEKVAPSE